MYGHYIVPYTPIGISISKYVRILLYISIGSDHSTQCCTAIIIC